MPKGALTQQTTEFRTAGTVRISKVEMPQDKAIAATKNANMEGYHMADSIELALLKETNPEVRRLLEDAYVMTPEKGLKSSGPCEILENGSRRRLSEKSWGDLNKEEQDKLWEAFLKIPIANRAWEYEGAGPVFAGYYDWYGGLGLNADGRLDFDAGRDADSRAWVVWVPDARGAGAPQNEASLEELLRNIENALEKSEKDNIVLSGLVAKLRERLRTTS
ncbi:MAG: hypothetical protein KGH60_01395 [Candidatus Micrarchaeota archaeon]|nr:hypothetical protein [Candidatus Micrarchaeota archaeon]